MPLSTWNPTAAGSSIEKLVALPPDILKGGDIGVRVLYHTVAALGNFAPEVAFEVYTPNETSGDVVNDPPATSLATSPHTAVPAHAATTANTLYETGSGIISGQALGGLDSDKRHFLKISVTAGAATTITFTDLRIIEVDLDYDGATL